MLPPTTDVRNHVRQMMLACTWLARTDLSPATRQKIEVLRDDIRDYLHFIASMLALRDRKRWFTDSRVPGYLIRSYGDDRRVHVPFHLFDDLPSSDALDELLSIATTVATDGSVICISGSSAMYGALGSIGDCDFCEYVDVDKDVDAMHKASEKVRKAAARPLVALYLKGWDGNTSWIVTRPWREPVVDRKTIDASRSIMSHYFADTKFEGALELTKLTLPVAASRPDTLKRSFPAQEMPVAQEGWLPRVLNEPSEISEYVTFLRDQTTSRLATGDHAKAVKRALSLARVLFLDAEADKILAIIRTSDLLVLSALRARAQYTEELRAYEATGEQLQQRGLATLVELCRKSSHAGIQALATVPTDTLVDAIANLPPDSVTTVTDRLREFLASVDMNIASAVH